MEKLMRVIVKESTHKKLKEIKKSEGGKNYPELLDEIIQKEHKKIFLPKKSINS